MRRLSPVLLGLLLGLGFSLVLNARSLHRWATEGLTVTDLGAELGSPDETYYFALIKDVADGHPNMGNASLYEHRDAPTLAGFVLLPQGLLARYAALDLATVIFLGDFFYTILLTCLAFLLFRKFVKNTAAAAFLALAYMAWTGAWLRVMHPQATMIVFFLALLTILGDTHQRRFWFRAVTLALMFLVQPIFAVYIIVVEALDGLMHLWKTRDIRSLVVQRWPLALGLAVAVGIQYWLQSGVDPAILMDTYARRGLIDSHLPAAPGLQLLLLALLGASWFLSRGKHTSSSSLVIVLLLAGLLVLIQSLIHGKDVVFGLYYHYPLEFVVWLAVAWLLSQFLRKRIAIVAAAMIALTGLTSLVQTLGNFTVHLDMRKQEYQSSDMPEVFELLAKRPGPEIVLAPIELSNLVPVLTPHYTLFTQYAHFEQVSDRELAERYMLLRSIFPLPEDQTVEGHPVVFGIAAGNLYARTKTMCKLRLMTKDCDKSLEDFIRNQDALASIRSGSVDTMALLAKFAVSVIVSDRSLPSSFTRYCKRTTVIGRYAMYDCHF